MCRYSVAIQSEHILLYNVVKKEPPALLQFYPSNKESMEICVVRI